MPHRIILTGATGMVGEGVLLTCLAQPEVEAVLSISRRPSGHTHPKLRELLVPDFFDLTAIESELAGYTACFFCAGVSSVGIKEAEYTRVTHDLTLHFAQMLLQYSPAAAFIYVSGAGTGGRAMWARVKQRTEAALLALPFRAAYMFRPGGMQPVAGQLHVLPLYRWLSWLMPLMRRFNYACTLREVALAMLRAAERGYTKPVLEVVDVVALAAG
ncbi:MAG: NAD-dependent epimerase/dehydratase family protein [Janthinobacterium lividum]